VGVRVAACEGEGRVCVQEWSLRLGLGLRAVVVSLGNPFFIFHN
jgi:hypothetical protein